MSVEIKIHNFISLGEARNYRPLDSSSDYTQNLWAPSWYVDLLLNASNLKYQKMQSSAQVL